MPKINELKLRHLKVNEIFTSISGETGGIPQGSIATFIRFAGCNMKCYFCDTPRTQDLDDYSLMTAQSVFEELRNHPSRNIILTGGEPLLQLMTRHGGLLVRDLFQGGYTVSVETNGSIIPVPKTDENKLLFTGVHHWIVDQKMQYLNDMAKLSSFLPLLTWKWEQGRRDKTLTFKFMVATQKQFDAAYERAFLNHIGVSLRQPELAPMIRYAFSVVPQHKRRRPEHAQVRYTASWLLENLLKKLQDEPQGEKHIKSFQRSIILNAQLHKTIGVA